MKQFVNLKLSSVLMMAGVFLMSMMAFAQGDPTKFMYGWNETLVSVLLGIASPYLTAFFTKSNAALWKKLSVLYGISIILAAAGGVITGAISLDGVKAGELSTIVTTLFLAGKVTYDGLRGHIKVVSDKTDGLLKKT